MSMQTLYHSVGGWVIRACSGALATQEFTQFDEKRRLKLGTKIGCDRVWCAESSNSVLQNGEDGRLGVNVDQRDGFIPSTEAIPTSKEETAPS